MPVAYEIDLSRLTIPRGTFVNLSDTLVLRAQIAKGLRAQLPIESLVTGVLYVELSCRSDSTLPKLEKRRTKRPEIPVTPSLMAAIGGGAGSLLAEVMKVMKVMNKVNGCSAR